MVLIEAFQFIQQLSSKALGFWLVFIKLDCLFKVFLTLKLLFNIADFSTLARLACFLRVCSRHSTSSCRLLVYCTSD